MYCFKIMKTTTGALAVTPSPVQSTRYHFDAPFKTGYAVLYDHGQWMLAERLVWLINNASLTVAVMERQFAAYVNRTVLFSQPCFNVRYGLDVVLRYVGWAEDRIAAAQMQFLNPRTTPPTTATLDAAVVELRTQVVAFFTRQPEFIEHVARIAREEIEREKKRIRCEEEGQ